MNESTTGKATMYNLQLLKRNMTVTGYKTIYKHSEYGGGRYEYYVQELPEYIIGICPFCFAENIEKVDTYSPDEWGNINAYLGLHGEVGTVYHCEHFVIVEPFLYVPAPDNRAARSNLWGDVFPHVNRPGPEHLDTTASIAWSTESQSPPFFIERQPTVIGFALEQGLAEAVIHALPVCEPVRNEFKPKYTLFMISYYSKNPAEAHSAIGKEALSRLEPISNFMLVLPEPNEMHWFDLAQWVERGLLYWVNVDENGEHSLRTHNVADFPYKNLEKLVSK